MEPVETVLGGAYNARGPFFPRQASGTLREVDKKIADLEKSISLVHNTILQAKGAFFWCAVDLNAITPIYSKIQAATTSRALQESDLYSDTGGIHHDMATVCNRTSILARLDKIQALEREFLQQEVSLNLLNTLRENNFLEHVIAFKKALHEKCTTNAPLEEQTEALRLEQEALSGSIAATKETLRSSNHDIRPTAQLDPAAVDALLQSSSDSDTEFRFWKKTDTYTWSISWIPGTYNASGALANELYETVGQKIAGIKKALETMLTHLFAGEDTDANSKLALYNQCIVALVAKLEEYRAKNSKTPFDAITAQLLDYMNGLDMALLEIQGLHDLVKRCTSPEYSALYKAQALVKNIIKSEAIALVPTLQEYQVSLAAFTTGEQVEAVANCFSAMEPLNTLSLCAKTTATTLQKVYTYTVSQDIAHDDTNVWQHIIQGQPFADLYYEHEQQDAEDPIDKATLTPHRLQTFVMSRACRALFARPPNYPRQQIDTRLELLLHALKTNPTYAEIYKENEIALLRNQGNHNPELELQFRKVYKKNGEFMHAVVTYEQAFTNQRNENHVALAYNILSDIFLAAKGPQDILTYAQLLQRCIEFDALDAASAEPSPHRILAKFLWTYLYSLREDTRQEDDIIRKFACFLYSTNEDKKETAEVAIHALLTQDQHEDTRLAFSDDIKQLLAEYTMERAFARTIEFTDYELQAFFDGPVEAFLSGQLSGFASRKLQHALYLFVSNELSHEDKNHTAKTAIIARMGQKAFEEWFSRYSTYLASSSVQVAFHRMLSYTSDTKAQTDLKKALGKTETVKWYTAIEKTNAFTKAFVRQ